MLIDTEYGKTPPNMPELKAHNIKALSKKLTSSNINLTLHGDTENFEATDEYSTPAERDAKLILNMFDTLPSTIHMRIRTNNDELVYCSVNSESLIGSVTEIGMKHGSIVQGVWYILGVYDARPDDEKVNTEDVDRKFGLHSDILERAAAHGRFLRTIGRPPHAHGVTPLLVFRKVGGSVS